MLAKMNAKASFRGNKSVVFFFMGLIPFEYAGIIISECCAYNLYTGLHEIYMNDTHVYSMYIIYIYTRFAGKTYLHSFFPQANLPYRRSATQGFGDASDDDGAGEGEGEEEETKEVDPEVEAPAEPSLVKTRGETKLDKKEQAKGHAEKTTETKTVDKKHGEAEVSTVPATNNPSLPASVPAVGPAKPDTVGKMDQEKHHTVPS